MTDPIDAGPGCYTKHGVSGYGAAVKLTATDPKDDQWVKEMAEKMMMSIAERCMAAGARCIGHIKSHIRASSGTVKADTIGVSHGAYSTGRLEHPETELFMAVNSIIQGIPEDKVREASLGGIHDVANRLELTVVEEKEHTYFDEFDYLTSDEDHERQIREQLAADGLLDLSAEDV